jgi:hypothetical protein
MPPTLPNLCRTTVVWFCPLQQHGLYSSDGSAPPQQHRLTGSAVSPHLGIVPPPLLILGFSSGGARGSLCPCGLHYARAAWALPLRLACGLGFVLAARALPSQLACCLGFALAACATSLQLRLCPCSSRYALAAWALRPRGSRYVLRLGLRGYEKM